MKLQDQIAITNMRLEGHSPSVIAAKLGLSPSTVRSHIHRHQHVRDEKSCKHCGNPLVQTKGRREKKFCSDSCRRDSSAAALWISGRRGKSFVLVRVGQLRLVSSTTHSPVSGSTAMLVPVKPV